MPLSPEEWKDSYRMRVLTRQIRFEDNPWPRKVRQPAPIVHGTTTGYRRGCRCDDCRIALNRAIKKYRSTPHTIPDHYHGTESAYTLHGCRCDKCRAAHTIECREKRKRRRER